jgi:hypothetical protein
MLGRYPLAQGPWRGVATYRWPRVDDHYLAAGVHRRDGSGKTADAGADDRYVNFCIPHGVDYSAIASRLNDELPEPGAKRASGNSNVS